MPTKKTKAATKKQSAKAVAADAAVVSEIAEPVEDAGQMIDAGGPTFDPGGDEEALSAETVSEDDGDDPYSEPDAGEEGVGGDADIIDAGGPPTLSEALAEAGPEDPEPETEDLAADAPTEAGPAPYLPDPLLEAPEAEVEEPETAETDASSTENGGAAPLIDPEGHLEDALSDDQEEYA